MADNVIYFKVELQEAGTIDKMKLIKSEMDKLLQKKRENKTLTVEETEALKTLTKQYSDLSKQVQFNTLEQEKHKAAIDNEGKTIQQLRDKAAALNKEWKNTEIGTAEYKKLSAQLKETNRQLVEQEKAVGIGGRAVGFYKEELKKIGPELKSWAIQTAGISAAIYGVTKVLGDALQNYVAFEKGLSNLSAITGLTGKELDFLKDKAIAFGQTGEVSATKAVEAFKLLASANPALLKNKEALASVTQQVIILSKASGLELPDAAKRLTDAMAQLNIPVQNAASVVDLLAVAAQQGKAEIPDLTEAILKSGVNANAAGVNLRSLSAAVELLAEKGLMGSEAGTKLNTVLIKLSRGAGLPPDAVEQMKKYGVSMDLLSDKTVPLEKKLVELKKVVGDTNAMTKIFEEANVSAARILIDNQPRYSELEKSFNKVGVAAEMASKNTDNLAGDAEKLANKWDTFTTNLLSSGSAFSTIARGGLSVLSVVLEAIDTQLNGLIPKLQNDALLRLAEGMSKYAQSLEMGIEKASTLQIVMARNEQQRILWNEKASEQDKKFAETRIAVYEAELAKRKAASDNFTKIDGQNKEKETEKAKKEAEKRAKEKEKQDENERKSEYEKYKDFGKWLDEYYGERQRLITEAAENEKKQREYDLFRAEKSVQTQRELDNELTDQRIANLERATDIQIMLDKQAWDKRIQFAQRANTAINGLQQIAQNLEAIRTTRISAEYDERQKLLQQQFERGLISEEQYNQKSDALKKEQALREKEAKKEMANINLSLKLAEIASSLAIGIMNAWATSMLLPVGGQIWAGVMTGILTGVAATETDLAIEQRNQIMKLSRGGLLGGKSHSEGGTVIEAEKDEVVINARSASMFRTELSAINQLGGGVAIPGNGIALPNGMINRGIDFRPLASMINGQRVIVTTRDLSRGQNRVLVTQRINRF